VSAQLAVRNAMAHTNNVAPLVAPIEVMPVERNIR
jgi:hypothetical protein